MANTRLLVEGPFSEIWPQPAAGDSGTALGAALTVAAEAGDRIEPDDDAALGRGWTDAEIEQILQPPGFRTSGRPTSPRRRRSVIADNGWSPGSRDAPSTARGRSGHRSLLAHPAHADNVERLNDIKGREQFRPVAPMVLAERAAEIFTRGPLPSPYMLFVHDVAPEWRDRLHGGHARRRHGPDPDRRRRATTRWSAPAARRRSTG